MADVHRAERWLAFAGLLALAAMLVVGVWRWHRRVVTERSGRRTIAGFTHALWFLAPFLFVLLAPFSGSAQEPCGGVFTVTAPGSAATSTCPADPDGLDAANIAASDNALAQAQSVCRLLRCGPPDPATATTEAVQLLACTTEPDGQVAAQISIRATCSTPALSRGRVPVPTQTDVPRRSPTLVTPQ